LQAVPELAGYLKRFEAIKANLADLKKKYEDETLPHWQQRADAAMAKWKDDAAKAKADGQPAPHKPPLPARPTAPDANPNLATVLTNGMIAPIVPYAIKGAIWYQGESNAGQAELYRTLFPTMISDWRTRWGEGDFPFIWVQLANFLARNNEPTQTPDGWPGLREAQSMTLKLPNTGQAVIIDIGQGSDIHPKDKLDVGYRLALAARHVAYGEDLVFSGPTYEAMKVEGDKIRLSFKSLGAGLTIAAAPSTQEGVPAAAPASELKGFAIAGSDHKFVWATATIEPSAGAGQVGDTVVVTSPDVHDPQAVRYAWANNPEANLYNKEGLPASPFRTDDWGAVPSQAK
jgi:sialate O-acetylesterase